VINFDFACLQRCAIANPEGPEALRLAWLQALATEAPRSRLIELVELYEARGFAIPEIDAFIDEELTGARERLEHAQQIGTISAALLGILERTIESAVAAERRRPYGGGNPILVHALELAAELENQR
jgi:hypothetical protein